MTLGLKLLLCINRKIFDFEKTPFRSYGFSVPINTLCETAGKGVCITRIDTGKNYSAYTIIQC